jgi:hypothetical protein
VQDLRKRLPEHRRQLLDNLDQELNQTVPPGLPMIKQLELFTKFRQFVPEEFRDELCPDPGTDVIDEIKGQRNTKRKAREDERKSTGS